MPVRVKMRHFTIPVVFLLFGYLQLFVPGGGVFGPGVDGRQLGQDALYARVRAFDAHNALVEGNVRLLAQSLQQGGLRRL